MDGIDDAVPVVGLSAAPVVVACPPLVKRLFRKPV